MRALVIDDSRAVRIIIGKILREIGIEVVEAGNGREALEQLAAQRRTSSWCWSTGTCRR